MQHPHPTVGDCRQLTVEVVRPQPHALAQFTEPMIHQGRSQRGPGSGLGADRRDDHGDPVAIPIPGGRIERVVLATLACEQSIGEPVTVLGTNQIPTADHPGERNPQRRLPDPEIGGQPQQFGRSRPGRVRTEEHRQHYRTCGQNLAGRLTL